MKVYLNDPKESWIVDRIRKEWYQNNPDSVTENIQECDILWIVAPWQWSLIDQNTLRNKKVVCTIHHIVPNKFNQGNLNEFLYRDQFVDAYIVPNKYTKRIVKQLTNKPVKKIEYWFNSELWNPMDKQQCRQDLSIEEDRFVIGSFQRDTEGSDLVSPKLEKGPDLFCDYVEKIKTEKTLVLLGGWRRQYVMNRLDKANIEYKYIEMAPIEDIKKMYAACDLYVVSSRHEGGPQALFEAAAMKVPIISNPVGIAESILVDNCVFDITERTYLPTGEDIINNFNKVKEYDIIKHKAKYIDFFKEISNGS